MKSQKALFDEDDAMITFDEERPLPAKIGVIGIGGAGISAINRLVESNIRGMEIIAADTDMAGLRKSAASIKFEIGTRVTRGTNCFGNPQIGQKATLDELAEFLKTHPTMNCELRGHTDPSGNMDYNEVLSLARANSVKDYFVKVHGIEKNRLSTLAYSRTKLVKESPERSRRVEIFLIK